MKIDYNYWDGGAEIYWTLDRTVRIKSIPRELCIELIRLEIMFKQNTRICKVCNQEKARLLAGKYPDGRNNKWVDNNSREWSGRVCGDCNVVRSKKAMRKARE